MLGKFSDKNGTRWFPSSNGELILFHLVLLPKKFFQNSIGSLPAAKKPKQQFYVP